MKRKTALYVRGFNDLGKSTNIKNSSAYDQATGLESQVRVLRQYCEHNNITDVEFYTDNGISGTKESRPALDSMMAAVERGEISSVVVHSFSRFARSTTHLLNALQSFKKKGVHFVSISEKIDTNSAVGVAIFSILAAIAQLERDLIASRVKIGLENARAKEDMDDRPHANVCSRTGYLIRLYLQQHITLKGADHPWKTQLCS